MYLFFGILVCFFFFGMVIYNGLISKKNNIETSKSSIDVYLKKRSDLIPDLVETVKQYASHESKLLSDLTVARGQFGSSKTTISHSQDSEIGSLFGKVFAVAENYPDLKANQNFINLQLALNEVEDQLAAARRAYNSSIKVYNDAIEMFPSSLIASFMGLIRKDVFKATEEETQKPNVKQLFK